MREERSECDVGWNDWLGRTRATLNACILLVEEFPGFGAIKPPDPSGLNDGGIEVAKIDAHSLLGPIGWFPVRHATAVSASTEPKALVSPDVTSQITLAGKDFHLAWIVVAPDPAVAATN